MTKDNAPQARKPGLAYYAGFVIVGAGAGYGAIKLWKMRAAGSPWPDSVALLMAIVFLALGVSFLAGGLSQPWAARLTRSETGRTTPAQRRQLSLQGVTFVLAGLLMMVPVLVPGVLSSLARGLVLGLVAAGLVVQTVVNIVLWRSADEFHRRAQLETSALCFWLLQACLFLWAVAAHFALVPQLEAWDAFVVLMAVYLGVSVVVSKRLGVA